MQQMHTFHWFPFLQYKWLSDLDLLSVIQQRYSSCEKLWSNYGYSADTRCDCSFDKVNNCVKEAALSVDSLNVEYYFTHKGSFLQFMKVV